MISQSQFYTMLFIGVNTLTLEIKTYVLIDNARNRGSFFSRRAVAGPHLTSPGPMSFSHIPRSGETIPTYTEFPVVESANLSPCATVHNLLLD